MHATNFQGNDVQRYALSVVVFCASVLAVAFPQSDPEAKLKERNQSNSARAQLLIRENFEQYAAYWTEEPGWHTDLQLRNDLSAKDLTVTPALRSADGNEANLAPVTIQPGDVVTVAVHDAVMKSAPQFTATYGSVVLRYGAPVRR